LALLQFTEENGEFLSLDALTRQHNKEKKLQIINITNNI